MGLEKDDVRNEYENEDERIEFPPGSEKDDVRFELEKDAERNEFPPCDGLEKGCVRIEFSLVSRSATGINQINN